MYPYPNAGSGVGTALTSLGFTDDQIKAVLALYQSAFNASGVSDPAGMSKYRAKLAQILGALPSQTDGPNR